MANGSRSRGRRTKPSLSERLRGLLGYDVLWTVLAILIIMLIMAPQVRVPEYDYQPGDIATSDVTAPVDLTVADPVATQRRQNEEEASVPDVYDYNPSAFDYPKRVVQSLFSWGRGVRDDHEESWDELDDTTRADLEQQAMASIGVPLPVGLIGALWDSDDGFSMGNELGVNSGVITLANEELVGNVEASQLAGSGILLRDITTQGESWLPASAEVIDLDMARIRVQTSVAERLDLPEEVETVLGDLVARLIQPNLDYSSNETQLRRRRAVATVDPAFYQVKRGRILLRQGDEVTAQKILELEALQQQSRSDRSLFSLAGTALLVTLAVLSLWRYVLHYQRRVRYQRVGWLYPLVLITLAGMVLLTRASLFLGSAVAAVAQEPFNSVESYKYAVPFATGGVLLLLLVDVQVAWAFSAVFAVMVAAMTQDLGLTVFAMLGSFAALFGMSEYRQRTALTRAGLIVGGINVATVVALALLATPLASWPIISFEAACAMGGGLLVSIAATVALPPLEHCFQSLTDIKLLELSNMNLPLLKELAVSAPGTYHHSVVVGTLAEKGAEAIGVNPLFVRVSAYYHDVGKLRQPQYFVENQKDGRNPHDKLSPSMSALILVSHVKDGVAYAQEHGLPQPLIDMVPQHHGTRLIRYFYEKARQAEGEEGREVDEAEFRYPGPKPQSKEAAILMLADSVEAISRTIEDPTHARLKTMIKRTVQEVIDDEQLDECALTLQDLALISNAFVDVLAGMHHQRIEYPEASEAAEPDLSVKLTDEDSGPQFSDQTYH